MRLSTLSLALFLCISLVVTVSAIPVLPHAFYGDVIVNGVPAPDGTQVSAMVNEGALIAGTQNPVTTLGGSFGKGDALPLLVQGEIADGAIITFSINGVATATTVIFETGGGPTAVSLSITTDVTPIPTQTTASVSSEGKSGSYAVSITPVQIDSPPEEGTSGETGSSDESPVHDAETAAVTTPAGTMASSTVQVQDTIPAPSPTQASLVYGPIALIAGCILFFACMKRY